MKISFFLLFVLLMGPATALAFTADGCAAGECRDCHNLTKAEAAGLVGQPEGDVIDVQFSEVPGLWVVDLRQHDNIIPVFIDFSKQYLISGSIFKLADRADIAQERFEKLNRIDVKRVPLEDAVILGDPAAPIKIIVFDDPVCPFCKTLHEEMKKVVATRPDIAFFIKLYPLKIHPDAFDKAKEIICTKSPLLLEDSLNGKEIPPPTCETDQVEKNITLAEDLGIRSTPTLIMPDGRIVPGSKPADQIIEMVAEFLETVQTAEPAKKEGD
ncbi:MAG: DsbC family protein [Proteobacteria bacterium]|nr:DsbC family protein [Pseudomonadota bacterium]MBU1685726.1 DsbC family protein [Pseudomonadota bacterium]